MKKMNLLLWTLTFLFAAAGSAHACLCFGPDGPKEAKKWADAVFSGEIIAFEKEGDSGLFTFRVERVWKGVTEQQLVLVDQVYKTNCGSGLKLGQRYIIFAMYEDLNPRTEKIEYLSLSEDGKPRPVIYPCGGSANLASPWAKKILKKIGRGRPLN
jgi:hypothetical protein